MALRQAGDFGLTHMSRPMVQSLRNKLHGSRVSLVPAFSSPNAIDHSILLVAVFLRLHFFSSVTASSLRTWMSLQERDRQIQDEAIGEGPLSASLTQPYMGHGNWCTSLCTQDTGSCLQEGWSRGKSEVHARVTVLLESMRACTAVPSIYMVCVGPCILFSPWRLQVGSQALEGQTYTPGSGWIGMGSSQRLYGVA
ncbi:hypothetical protein AOLI_G00158060 [Acnodon oligacanthus]